MFNANDHNLEETGKNAAEQFFDESLIPSWHQLEKKLDIELPVKKKRRRFVALYFLFTLLFIASFYKTYDNSHNNKQEKYTTAELTDKESSKQKNLILPDQEKDNKGDLKVNANQADQTFAGRFIDKSGVNKVGYIFSAQPNNQFLLNFNSFGKRRKVVNNQLNKVTIKSPDEELLIEEAEKDNSANNYSASINTQNLQNKKYFVNTAVENTIVTDLEKNTNPEKKNPLTRDSANNAATSKNKNKKESKFNRFTITALAGSNINSVHLNKYSKPGFDYGLMAGYRISPKLEIRTGIILSRKYFTANGKSMSFDSAKLNLPSYNSINLNDATGYCRFIEVPVMLYYHFSSKSKTSFYAGAGFSINKMRMENIRYTFLLNSNTIVERTHAGAYHDANSYAASFTSNFSFGLNQKISNRLSVAFEPYIKIPLNKVNNNDLKFTTLGASASLILNLPSKKKK